MGEEFEESEVVFSEISEEGSRNCGFRDMMRNGKTVVRSGDCSSIPVRIPAENARRRWEVEGGGEGEMVPPHVMTAAAAAGTAFSVRTGKGRTLKGRDLRRVRNSVLRMTGFIEP